MIPKELFLSHSANNRAIASGIADTLRRHNVPVWYSDTNIKTAAQWHDEIGRALRRCDWFFVLLSKHSIASRWVKYELRYALNHSQYDEHIVSVRLDGSDYEELSWVLEQFQMVDWSNPPVEAVEKILNTWGLALDDTKLSDSFKKRKKANVA